MNDIFMAFDWESGNLIQTRYVINSGVVNQNSIHEQGDYIYIIFMTSLGNLIGELNKNSLSIQNTYQTSVNYNRFVTGTNATTLIASGESNSKCVISQMSAVSISSHPDFESTPTLEFSLLADSLFQPELIYFPFTASYGDWYSGSLSPSNGYITISTSESFGDEDIVLRTSESEYNFTTDYSFTISPNITCSPFGTILITYKIVASDSEIPSFVNIDTTTGVLTGTTPDLGENTQVQFNINSTWSAGSNLKLIKINIESETDGFGSGSNANISKYK